MQHRSLVIVVSITLFFSCLAYAKIIHVPADQPTIQAGINAAASGDTVLVAPGTYFENINFNGKAITVKSLSGAAKTIIDGSQLNTVVTFSSGETTKSVLTGLTIRNGSANPYGGGIFIQNSSPSLIGNIITGNQATNGGGGIGIVSGSPVIQNNTISDNHQNPHVDLGVGGGAIMINGPSSAQIVGNKITGNSWTASSGGVTIQSATAPMLMNNTISSNSGYDGGGLWVEDTSSVLIVQNAIIGNTANNGGGVYLFPLHTTETFLMVNNTVADNKAETGAELYVFGVDDQSRFFNNVFAGGSGIDAVYCDADGGSIFTDTDAYESGSGDFGGTCANQIGVNGNISADPRFVNPPSNFRLRGGSPAIDAGDNNAPNLPTKDFAGNPRIVNGNDGSSPIVDMGAYEFIPVVLPHSLSFGTHTIGSHTAKILKLINNLNHSLTITNIVVTGDYTYVNGCGTTVPAFTACSITVTFTPTAVGSRPGTLTVTDVAGNSPQTVKLTGTGQ